LLYFSANLDWNKTTAYCRTPSSNGITIRVAEKPGNPGVKPDDYDSFRDQLICDLKELRDPSTGERIITEIHKREDVFSGPAMKEAPDLLMVLRDFGFVSIKNKQPVVEAREEVAGTHHPDGVFFAFGPGIKEDVQVGPCNIEDVGATLLYSLGLDVPSDMEGLVAEAMFTESYLAENPVRIGAATNFSSKDTESESMAEDEKEKLMAQLKLLGYME